MDENVIGGRFSIDVSDLSAGLKRANQLINLSNSEFKNATAGMDDWQNSADGLSAKIKNLNDVVDLQQKKVNALQAEYDKCIAEGTDPMSRSMIALQTKINNETASLERNKSQLSQTQQSLANFEQETNVTATASEKLRSEIDKQESELKQLQKEYMDTVLEQGDASEEAQILAQRIGSLSGELNDNKTKMNNAEKSAQELAKSLEDTGDSANEADGGFTVLKGALSEFIGNVITGAVSKIGELAGSLFDLVEATEEYRSMTSKLEGASNSFGYSTEYASSQFENFYRYLGDNQMATNAITNLMGLGTTTDSVSKLAEGAIGVWASYGDSIPIESLTESINETIQVGKVTGTFADTINWAKSSNEELANSLGNGSEAQKAFNKAIAEGETSEDAFSSALASTNDTQERANIVAKFLNGTYGESKKTYDDLNGTMLNANETELELIDSQAELANAVSPVKDAFTKLKTKALEAILPIVEDLANSFLELMDYLKEHPKLAKTLTGLVIALAGAFTVLAGALAIQGLITGVSKAIGLLNLALLANPIVLIVSAIVGLVAGFIYLWKTSDKFRNFWIGLWDGIVNAVTGAWEWMKTTFDTIINFVKENWQGLLLLLLNPFAGAFKLIYDNSETFRNFIDTLIQNIKEFFVNGWNAIVTFFTEGIPTFLENVKAWFADLPYKLGYLIGQLIGHIILFFQKLWNFATVDIPNFIGKVVEWFASLPGKIWTWLVNAYNNVVTWGKNVYNAGVQKAQEFIDGVVKFFRELPGKIWTWLTNTVSKVISWGADMIRTGKEKMVEFKDGIIEKIKKLPEDMKNVGKDMLAGFVKGVKENIDDAIKKVKKFFSGIVDGVKNVLDSHSPSRVFEQLGDWSAEGYGIGFEKEMKKVKASIMDTMDLGSDLNVNLNKSGGLLNNQNAQLGKTVVVNQTINSPKAISRADLYMQTKSIATTIALSN